MTTTSRPMPQSITAIQAARCSITAGEVIGMDTALISPTTGSVGLGYAQPSANVKFVTERLIRDGWVRPGWAGGRSRT